MFIVAGQQLLKSGVVQLRVQTSPVRDLLRQFQAFLFQGLLAFLAGLEVGAKLDQLAAERLQLLVGRSIGLPRMLHRLVHLLLPGFDAGVFADQADQLELAGLLLFKERGATLFQLFVLLFAGLLADLLQFDFFLALALFLLLFALLFQLAETLRHLLVELHEGRRRIIAQALQGLVRQQAGEGAQFLFQSFLIGAHLALLIEQLLMRRLAGFGSGLQLLLEPRGILLQGEQGGLPLLVLVDVLLQLVQLLAEPSLALGAVLLQERGVQGMGLQARRQFLVLLGQLFLLGKQFFLLGNQPADLFPKLVELFRQRVDRLPCRGFFVLIVTTEALQQRLGLMVGVFMAATHRAR